MVTIEVIIVSLYMNVIYIICLFFFCNFIFTGEIKLTSEELDLASEEYSLPLKY